MKIFRLKMRYGKMKNVRTFKFALLILLIHHKNTMAFHKQDLGSIHIQAVTKPVQHAEGPVWEPKSQTLLYVDTFTATAHRWGYFTNANNSHKFDNHDSIGVIIPIKSRTDYFLVGADRDLYTFFWPAENSLANSRALKQISRVDKDKPSNQFNDGKADAEGRLWIGTLTRNKDLSVTPNGGTLYLIKGENLNDITEKISRTSISNGLDWSVDNKQFLYIDSLNRTVVVFDFDLKSGNINNKRVLFDLNLHPEYKGIPDGMTIDAEGNLWVALFGGKALLNIDNCGKILREIEMPTTYVTSACFGGPNLDILYVTTSRLHLNESQLEQEPLAGAVFAIENLGVVGKPVNEIVL